MIEAAYCARPGSNIGPSDALATQEPVRIARATLGFPIENSWFEEESYNNISPWRSDCLNTKLSLSWRCQHPIAFNATYSICILKHS